MRIRQILLGPLLAGLYMTRAAIASEIDENVLAELPAADVIVLGEVHDNPRHHLNQALAIAALSPKAIVFEMFGPNEALAVTPEVRGRADRLAEALDWESSGWPDFAMYHPIFLAAPDAVIFGGDMPREEVRRAVTEGAAAVLGGSAPLFGLDQPLDPDEQAQREAGQMTAHCDALPKDILPGMVEAQRLRDAALARAVLAAMAETGGPVAVVTGNGHARRDWGLPRMLERAAPALEILSVGQFESPPDGVAPHDLWLVTPPVARDDPCAVFRD
jgi:uncharacterized iron-regulated protein